MSDSINKLWNVIGIGGCRLDEFNKTALIPALSSLTWRIQGTSLWDALVPHWEEGNLAEMPEANPPLDAGNFEEILGQIVLSKYECWQAIAEIAIVAANKEAEATNPGPKEEKK